MTKLGTVPTLASLSQVVTDGIIVEACSVSKGVGTVTPYKGHVLAYSAPMYSS